MPTLHTAPVAGESAPSPVSAHAAAPTVPDLVTRAAGESPDAIALTAACGALSFAALDGQAGQLAACLRALGVGPDALVGICLDRSFDQIVSVLAVWRAGAAYLPLDPAWPDQRLSGLLGDAGCAALICSADTVDRLGQPELPRIIVDRDREAIARFPVQPPSPVPAERLAYVIYTSGSTGAPKGVEITHGNLANLVAWHNVAFGVGAADRGAHLAGLGFDAAVWEIWPYLSVGATVSLVPDPARTSGALLRDWLLETGVTIAFAPTALAEQLIAADWPADTRLRVLLTGADTLHKHPPAGLPFALVNNYGPTECTVVATSGIVGLLADESGLPAIGRPIGNTQIHILGADGAPVAAGETGEISIGGASVGRGYRGRPDLTAERFVPDPFSGVPGARLYRTGDLASLRTDGQIAFHGRADDQVKIRGHRIEPGEVARALGGHEAVATSAIVARADDRGEPQLVAYIVFADGRSAGAEEIRAHLADRLPEYMVPGAFARLDALPLTANGKVDFKALPAPDAGNALADSGFAAPTTPAEERLAEILAEVMGRGRVGIDDNFFLLGGHSLLGTQLVLRANEAFGVDLTLRHLFQAPTVRQLAVLIEDLVMQMIEAMSDDEAQLRAAG